MYSSLSCFTHVVSPYLPIRVRLVLFVKIGMTTELVVHVLIQYHVLANTICFKSTLIKTFYIVYRHIYRSLFCVLYVFYEQTWINQSVSWQRNS